MQEREQIARTHSHIIVPASVLPQHTMIMSESVEFAAIMGLNEDILGIIPRLLLCSTSTFEPEQPNAAKETEIPHHC